MGERMKTIKVIEWIEEDKIMRKNLTENGIEKLDEAVFLEDIKSAVEWLLKEIDKEQEKILNETHNHGYGIYKGMWTGLEIAKEIIKKGFEVIKNERSCDNERLVDIKKT